MVSCHGQEMPDFVISGAGEERVNGEYISIYKDAHGAFYYKKGDAAWILDSWSCRS